MLTWHPDMWGLCGSHTDSTATSDKIGVKTTKEYSLHLFYKLENKLYPVLRMVDDTFSSREN
jgi:hypothetical protein